MVSPYNGDMRLLLALFFLAPSAALAAFIPTLPSSAAIELIPELPGPGETFTARAYNPPQGTTSFEWRVNGKVVDQARTGGIVLTAGSAGEETVLELLFLGEGELAQATKVVVPHDIALVWEGNSYTPPFYTGRPLVTPESTVTVTAIPRVFSNGAPLSPSTLEYRWFMDGSKTPFRSGVGVRSVTVKPPFFGRAFSVSVEVEGAQGAFGRASALLTPARPELLVFEDAPLLGPLVNREVRGGVSGETEARFVVFPLFTDGLETPPYQWEVNGETVEPGENPRMISFRKASEGAYTVTARFEDDSLFGGAARNFLLRF